MNEDRWRPQARVPILASRGRDATARAEPSRQHDPTGQFCRLQSPITACAEVSLRGAEHRMQVQRRRVAAGGCLPAEGLGHRPHVVRCAAAADPDVPGTEIGCLTGEVGHLEAGVRERFEFDRKGAPAVRVGQRLEGRCWPRRSGRGPAGRRSGYPPPPGSAASSGIIVAGPREQFSPTTAAPASASTLQAST